MNGRFLLDTNIIIALFAKDKAVQDHLIKAKEVFIPNIVLGELYYGAHKSAHVDENVTKIDELAENSALLPCDLETAKNYGIIKNSLKIRGKPIPENDIWIAAVAKQYQLILVSRDAHFREVEEISIQTW